MSFAAERTFPGSPEGRREMAAYLKANPTLQHTAVATNVWFYNSHYGRREFRGSTSFPCEVYGDSLVLDGGSVGWFDPGASTRITVTSKLVRTRARR